jgi:agmatinase
MNPLTFGEPEFQSPDPENAQIVVLPLCYENAVSYGTGTGSGPLHILNASVQLEMMDEETFTNWGKFGIHTLPPLFPSGNPEQAVGQMKQAARKVLEKQQFLLSLGGDHAISIGPIMAAAEIYPDLGVLQVDAHLDLRNTWNGSRYNHACVMRRVIDDIGLPAVQVGIRSFSSEEVDFIRLRGLSPFFAHQIAANDPSWMQQVIDRLPERVYMTIDLDGLDPSVLPGTGTPEPGGLTYRQLVGLIQAVGRSRKVVAADINELSKIEGATVSEFTAAKLATKLFVYCLNRSA